MSTTFVTGMEFAIGKELEFLAENNKSAEYALELYQSAIQLDKSETQLRQNMMTDLFRIVNKNQRRWYGYED